MAESFHVFEPRPGELARAFIDRSEGALSEHGVAARYRVVRAGRTVAFEGTRDACIDLWRVPGGALKPGPPVVIVSMPRSTPPYLAFNGLTVSMERGIPTRC